MPINNDLPFINTSDIDKAKSYIHTIENLFPVLINLSPKDKQTYSGIKNTRETIVKKIEQHAGNNNMIVPLFASLSTLKTRYNNFKQLKALEKMLLVTLEKIQDTAHNEGHLAYKEALKIYDTLELANGNSLPGIDIIYNDIKHLFPRTGKKKKPSPSAHHVEDKDGELLS